MKKRIFKLLVWIFCFGLVIPYSFVFPAICILALFRYIIYNKEPLELIFIPLEWIFDLPDKIKL